MICPDCKGQVELVEVTQMVMNYDDPGELCEDHYYKCPICKIEIAPEDLGEE